MEANSNVGQVGHGSRAKLSLSKEWELILDRYKPNKIIGQGASGIVVGAKDCNKNYVAIKHIKSGF